MMYETSGSLAEVMDFVDPTAQMCVVVEHQGTWTITLMY